MSRVHGGCHSMGHCIVSVQYHIIWCPKFRFHVLDGDAGDTLKGNLEGICKEYHYRIKAMEVMPDHIHLFLDIPHTVAPCDVVRTLKSLSAVRMFQHYPSLKTFYSRCGSLWSRGYYLASVGHISETTVKKYIEEQKNHGRTT